VCVCVPCDEKAYASESHRAALDYIPDLRWFLAGQIKKGTLANG
jgi:hypothetical protein